MKSILGLTLLSLAALAAAGPYASNGIHADDPRFQAWATGFENLNRGPRQISDPTGAAASFGSGDLALGTPKGSLDAVSLGDGGSITVTFGAALRDGTGADFAVFEQGFSTGGGLVYAELGFVEVSSNGVDFVRFASRSLTPITTQVASFGSLDPTNIHNLAGQFVAFEGTPFDLSELRGTSSTLNVDAITHVRIVDVVGSIDPLYARVDSVGSVINDPWPTPFASSGFDLDAVGALNVVPEPGTLTALMAGAVLWLRRKRR